MSKLGIGCTPLAGDKVVISMDNGTVGGTVVNWGVEAWDQYWLTLKTEKGSQVQINIAKIQDYTIQKRAEEAYQLVRQEIKDSKTIKSARAVQPLNPNVNYTIKRGINRQKENVISRSIATPAKGVEELQMEAPKMKGDPVSQSKQLAELYDQKRKLVQENVSDHMKREDLIEVNENYGMPSFKKHP